MESQIPQVPNPNAVMAKNRSLRDLLESRDFYELCQQYRNQPIDAAKEFEAIKDFLITGTLPWPSYGFEESED